MKIWLKILGWISFIALVIFLMFKVKDAQLETIIDAPEITISVKGENAFLTKDELLERLERKGLIYYHQKYKELKPLEIERFINTMNEVKNSKVYTNIGTSWKIEIELRKPIARVINKYGENYYIDEEGGKMPLSNLHTAHVLIVTGEIKDRLDNEKLDDIINNDSLKSIRKLDDIYFISNYVCKDQLFHSLIGQIHRLPNGDFVLIPKIGGQKIVFGSAYTQREVEEKFKKLKVFYKEAIPYEGWNKYDEFILKYANQIVCKKKS